MLFALLLLSPFYPFLFCIQFYEFNTVFGDPFHSGAPVVKSDFEITCSSKHTWYMPPLTSLPPSVPHPQFVPRNSETVPGKQWSCRWPAWRLANTYPLVQRMEKGCSVSLQSLQFTRWKFQLISTHRHRCTSIWKLLFQF